MIPPTPSLTTHAQQIKQAAINRDRRTRRLLVPLATAAVLVGVAVWFLADPRDRDEIHASAAIGLGLAVFFVGCLLGRMLDPLPAVECPQCGCDWNVESEYNLQKWLAWQNCPGCGLEMSREAPPE